MKEIMILEIVDMNTRMSLIMVLDVIEIEVEVDLETDMISIKVTAIGTEIIDSTFKLCIL
jgi:hypothetical protein